MIAAAGADELKYVCVAAVEASVHDADWLAPQERRAPVAGLAGQRECHDILRPDAQPRVTMIVRTRCGDGGRTDSRSGTGHGVKVARTAHSTHRQAVVPAAAGVWSSDVGYHQTITRGHCPANVQPSRITPGHPMLSRCFLVVCLGDE